MKYVLPPCCYKYGDLGIFGRYYPSYITKEKNGLYGIVSNGIERRGLISGKAMFDKIGIPEFNLCGWQNDGVLQGLHKSLLLDILNEAFNFKNEAWAEKAEKHFFENSFKYYESRNGESNPLLFDNFDIRKQLYGPDSKYINAPFFYLAHPGHICLNVSHIYQNENIDTPHLMWIRVNWEELSYMSKQLHEDDVIIVPKNVRPLYRMDKRYYFCILEVVNLSSLNIRFVEFNFALLYHKSVRDVNREMFNGKGEVTVQIEQFYKEYAGDHIRILTKNCTQDAYIKLSNCVEKEIDHYGSRLPAHTNQFSYDYATDDEIRKVKDIIKKKDSGDSI